MKKSICIVILLLSSQYICSFDHRSPSHEKITKPWFTGPLLSGSASTIDPGTTLVEPRLYVYTNYAKYNAQSQLEFSTPKALLINPIIKYFVGLIKNLDLGFTLPIYKNFFHGRQYLGFGDTSIIIRHRFIEETALLPQTAFALQIGFPTGNYHHLDPAFETVDGSGAGGYFAALNLRFEKLLLLSDYKWLRVRAEVYYTFTTKVTIKGRSVYNTTEGARGSVRPGNSTYAMVAAELQLTQNWALACTLSFSHNNRSPFSGFPGIEQQIRSLHAGKPSSEQLSLAPGIEYNFSDKLGVIGGVWFTCAGRNSSAFYTEILSVNYKF